MLRIRTCDGDARGGDVGYVDVDVKAFSYGVVKAWRNSAA